MKLKALKRPLALIAIYAVCQLILVQILFFPLIATHAIELSESGTKFTSNVAIVLMCLVSLVSLVIPACMAEKSLHMFEIKKVFAPTGLSFPYSAMLLAVGMIGAFGAWILCDLMGLPDNLADDFAAMMHHPFGVLTGCVLAPVGEEILFRGAIQEWMHRYGMKPAWAIFFSALIFGVIHMNPVQMVDASLAGIILGILYWKTRSLILPALLHIIANSLSVGISQTWQEQSFSDIFGGTAPTVLVMAACLAIWGVVYWRFIKSQPNQSLSSQVL